MTDNIIFRMVAWTDAAGKYDPDAPLNGNEDNYYADDDLSDATPNHVIADKDIILSDCGMIMAVADGMGGMNAGEVASQIAHDTVAEYFAPGKITPQLAERHENRSRYMEEVVHEADRRIKKEARQNHEREGMGSTLILAWLAGNELSITWIGDSRAYRFNPDRGIEALSKDHSYVQELVDKGVLTYEQTFEHPQGNIITRSLGDESKKACPESRLFKVHDGDIILLCSDGLSGVLRDRKTYDENGELYPGENIEDILRKNSSSLKECREALWMAAEQADWYDNVTAILCEIRGGAGKYAPADGEAEADDVPHPHKNTLGGTFDGFIIKISRKKVVFLLILAVIIIASIGGGFWYSKQMYATEDTFGISDSLGIIAQPADSVKKDTGSPAVPVKQVIADDGKGRRNTTDEKEPPVGPLPSTRLNPEESRAMDSLKKKILVKDGDSLTKKNSDTLTPIIESR